MSLQIDLSQLAASAKSIGIVVDQICRSDGSDSLNQITTAMPGSQASTLAGDAAQQYKRDQQLLADRIRSFEEGLHRTANRFATADLGGSHTLESINQPGK